MKNAAKYGDVAAMAALGAKNPRLLVEPVESYQSTALHNAAYKGHVTGA